MYYTGIMTNSGRNCAFFPVFHGRFDSLLTIQEDRSGIIFFMPQRHHTGDVIWKLIIIYAFLGMVAFVTLLVGVNNKGWDPAVIAAHPQLPLFLAGAAAAIVIPFALFSIRAARRPYPAMVFDRDRRTLTAGYRRRQEWREKKIETDFPISRRLRFYATTRPSVKDISGDLSAMTAMSSISLYAVRIDG